MIGQRDLLRQRRDLGQIIEAALQVYGQNFSVFFSIAAVATPLRIADGIFQDTIKDDLYRNVVVNLLTVAEIAVGLLVAAAIIYAIADIANGVAPEFGRSYDAAFARFSTIVGAELRLIFHVLLFTITIIGIPWAIQRFVRWSFVQQAVVLDGKNAKDALSVSAAAVEGSWWRTAGISLALGVPAAIATLAFLFFPFGPVVVSSTLSAAAAALVAPFFFIAMTLLYSDLKSRKEQALAAEASAPAEEEM